MIRDDMQSWFPPGDVWECAVGLAVLDAVIGSDLRTMRREPDGTQVFHYDHGSGDELRLWFTPAGAVLMVGFDHESPMSPYASGAIWPGIFDGLPPALCRYVEPPDDAEREFFPGSFSLGGPDTSLVEATFAAWHLPGSGGWRTGCARYAGAHPARDGSWLLACFGLDHWIERSGMEAHKALAASVCDHRPLSDADLRSLNASCDVARVRNLMNVLGYGKRPAALR